MKGNYAGIDTALRQPWPLAARTILSAQENINVTTGTGCSKKGIFPPNQLLPIPRLHIAARDLLCFQCNASDSHWLSISEQPISAQCWQGRGGKICKKNLFSILIDLWHESVTLALLGQTNQPTN